MSVDITRPMFDRKMAAILSGAGGASSQLCTATHKELKDQELILQGLPINKQIFDAIEMFGELEDIESFFSLSYNDRVNFTHESVSTINITPFSTTLLYMYFRWFNLLVYHEQW